MEDGMITSEYPAVLRAEELVRRFAKSKAAIVFVGPTGAGKDAMARLVHRCSGRSGRLVEVNCGALPPELVEGQLFGHRRGAFSGASADTIGFVEAAADGTLFLDELTSMPLVAQAKLLRVLEDGSVTRVGETKPRAADVRFVAAVQAQSRAALEPGLIRQDLLHRLGGIVIELPALRDRLNDVVRLARLFASRQGVQLDSSVAPVLLGYSWPGNIRELKLTVERAAALSSSGVISGSELAEALDLGIASTLDAGVGEGSQERTQLLDQLAAANWHAVAAAHALGIGRSTLFRRLKSVGLSIVHAKQAHARAVAAPPRRTT